MNCWYKLEHFSPAPLPKGDNVRALELPEPWKQPQMPPSKGKVYEYTVYLGLFNSLEVTKFISEFFEESAEEEEDSRPQTICYASLRLDQNGHYLDGSFGVSTLPWALNQLREGNIEDADWSKDFDELRGNLEQYIDSHFKETITNEEGEVIRVTTQVSHDQLVAFEQRIIKATGWEAESIKEVHRVRFTTFKRSSNKEATYNADILNSFFLKDLERIISQRKVSECPLPLGKYLDGNLNSHGGDKTDVLQETGRLKEVLSPENYPDGCWPSPYSLNLMQQFAVNTFVNGMAGTGKSDVFSVNGPPGTGKTTLLRDIIASVVVDKAKKLAAIPNPVNAFISAGSLETTGNFTPFIHAPVQSLKDSGIVIASSNNGAVENISRELPLKAEIGADFRDRIDYFKQVASDCMDDDAWGLISVVLGNSKNRRDMMDRLWFNSEPKDLRRHLANNKLNETSTWNTTRNEFNTILDQVQAEKAKLAKLKKASEEFTEVKEQWEALSKEKSIREAERDRLVADATRHQQAATNAEKEKEAAVSELNAVRANKPGFFAYWFSSSKRTVFRNAQEAALKRYNEANHKISTVNKQLRDTEAKLKTAKSKVTSIVVRHEKATKQYKELEALTVSGRKELGTNYADADFWQRLESKAIQEVAPWCSSELRRLQSELFLSALRVREVFIRTANAKSSKVATTLMGFFEYLKGETQPSPQQIQAMWHTFFLVVPVISTTFASVQTMFKQIGVDSIPWLLIDEAGQSVPQSAAGAIWRARRVGIVGDPFQIEPVVTIPKLITKNLRDHFNLKADQVSDEFSVQVMADRVNPYGAELEQSGKKSWVGIPLRVHRRCLEPMFSIANNIAYDNKMYCSTLTPNTVGVSFATDFIHVKGKVKGRHFVPEQAEVVFSLLKEEIRKQKKLPDVFVITPFTEVRYQLWQWLENSLRIELSKVRKTEPHEVADWLKEHVGTVHTFQGKQAEGVIFCLGLDESKTGAAGWAAQKPNLLNVALTRAKYRFVAVGDKDLWLNQAYFGELQALEG